MSKYRITIIIVILIVTFYFLLLNQAAQLYIKAIMTLLVVTACSDNFPIRHAMEILVTITALYHHHFLVVVKRLQRCAHNFSVQQRARADV